jgi:hypothetical protein
MTYSIEVENKFEMAQRDIHVSRKLWEESLDQRSLAYPVLESGIPLSRQVIDFELGAVAGDEDYLEIRVDDEQSELGPCKVDLPANVPFTFVPAGVGSITVVPPENGSNITSLKIPSSIPTWKLEVMRPMEPAAGRIPHRGESDANNVTIGDDEPGGDG